MPKRACDLCHRRKEKCQFDKGSDSCSLCRFQGIPCLTERKKRRMGRRPAMPVVLYGSCDVLSFDAPHSIQRLPSPKTVLEPLSGLIKDLTLLSLARSSNADAVGIVKDHCVRPLVVRGARDPDRHREINVIMSNKPIFFGVHRYFMIGPSFADGFSAAIQVLLTHSRGAMLTAYLAVFAMWDEQFENLRGTDEATLARGIDCLKILRTISVEKLEDAAVLVGLAQILAVYHVLTTCTSAHPIARSALLSVHDWYPEFLARSELDPITIAPIVVDTVECLVRREIPIVRVSFHGRCPVDRYFGLGATLLPILYRLCERSYQVKTASAIPIPPEEPHADPYCDIELEIKQWNPNPTPEFFTDFNPLEIVTMLMQARVYRTAALLVIHRLRYPLGVEDEVAALQAESILADLTGFVGWAPEYMRGLAVSLPLLLAMLEIDGPGELVMEKLIHYGWHTRYKEKMHKFVGLARAARTVGYRGLWFDLVDDDLQIPFIP
ncbi:hypothetical protein BX600DRAFT_466870 [Xylariales sp. PMI_506]|nr:hypothetical protein BX600DRAFT_466870 [Xylariales sp. PMI_506]